MPTLKSAYVIAPAPSSHHNNHSCHHNKLLMQFQRVDIGLRRAVPSLNLQAQPHHSAKLTDCGSGDTMAVLHAPSSSSSSGHKLPHLRRHKNKESSELWHISLEGIDWTIRPVEGTSDVDMIHSSCKKNAFPGIVMRWHAITPTSRSSLKGISRSDSDCSSLEERRSSTFNSDTSSTSTTSTTPAYELRMHKFMGGSEEFCATLPIVARFTPHSVRMYDFTNLIDHVQSGQTAESNGPALFGLDPFGRRAQLAVLASVSWFCITRGESENWLVHSEARVEQVAREYRRLEERLIRSKKMRQQRKLSINKELPATRVKHSDTMSSTNSETLSSTTLDSRQNSIGHIPGAFDDASTTIAQSSDVTAEGFAGQGKRIDHQGGFIWNIWEKLVGA